MLHKLLTNIYVLLCLVGMIIQVVQISTNYFTFEVVSDIKLINNDLEVTGNGNIMFYNKRDVQYFKVQ